MINNEAFAKRLQKVIDFYGESGSSFAEKIGVQRSTISHILSGRNKPSLEFVLKVLSSFPEVELYWLMNGKGIFPAETKTEEKIIEPQKKEVSKLISDSDLNSESSLSKKIPSSKKDIERIVIFYKDGSFKNFENS
ncbi:helix-turn-helix domain-containing protein [Lacinutrix salivirga]